MTWPDRFTRKLRQQLAAALFIAIIAGFAASALQARGRQSNAEYAARRARLVAQVDGPVVVFGYTGKENTLEFLRFQQEENFYYLTGINEEGAAVVLVPARTGGNGNSPAREILFLAP